MLTPLLAACAGNCQNASKALMDAGASLTLADEGENTPLHWLVRRDAVELVKLALQKGAPIDALNALSETALLTGVKLGKRNVVELLLKEGATVQRDSIGSKAPTNKTACHFAMQYGAEGGDAADACAILAAILKKKPDVNAVDGEKRSALHYAVVNDDLLPAVKELISAGAAVGQPDWSGQTPIHWACFLGASQNVKALLDAKAAADAVDDHRRTALHRAAESNNEVCVSMLLDGAHVALDAVDVDGYSALHYAARAGALSCVKRLLEGGANRHLVSASGACAIDVTVDKNIHELLRDEHSGMKRQRMSSSTNLMLPDLGAKFYAACAAKDVKAVLALCTPEVAQKQRKVLEGLVASPPAIGQMHASARTSTIAVEHAGGLHLLGFTESGLLHSFRPFTES
mmetsp:Transcript_7576/g.22726  ORF Transcript_7576/g.22726 Transcript_7576/m.22726 type:complete len:402 (+) Transcript_7576:154-1359(+)